MRPAAPSGACSIASDADAQPGSNNNNIGRSGRYDPRGSMPGFGATGGR
ncbi:MAG: hypothetical protein JWM77_1554 [Rhodospirillales bacterium]|nr:hypothetical protein [Rhodospirillales bacterium]